MQFELFVGVAPRRYLDLFGASERKDKRGRVLDPGHASSTAMRSAARRAGSFTAPDGAPRTSSSQKSNAQQLVSTEKARRDHRLLTHPQANRDRAGPKRGSD